MRILILSFYFEPDLSAGSFRASALLRSFASAVPAGTQIDLLTTLPNRYETFRRDAAQTEHRGDVTIRRFELPAHRNGFIDQSKAFLAYARQVLAEVCGKQYDLVIATSARLFTAALASLIARWKGARLYLDIRDIFVDTMVSLLPKYSAMVLVPIFGMVERFTVSRASRINLVSGGFLDYFQFRYPRQSFVVIPNGIDDEFLSADFAMPDKNERIVVLYAGNLGSGQGLDRIVPGIARALASSHDFVIVGDGGQKSVLEDSIAGLENVRLMAPVCRTELVDLYRRCDVLFLHLNSYPAFLKVLPSKLFEYAATGKPILAGVAGYPAKFLTEVPNTAVFPPCNVVAGVAALLSLKHGSSDRTAFINRYRRSALMSALVDDILANWPKPLSE